MEGPYEKRWHNIDRYNSIETLDWRTKCATVFPKKVAKGKQLLFRL